jgi:hypothetical protein
MMMPLDGFSFVVFAISRTTRYTLRVYPSRYIFLLYRRGCNISGTVCDAWDVWD